MTYLPDVTVVLCTYNRAEMLRNAMQSVSVQETNGGFNYDIVVVDNASTDNTREVVKEVTASSPVAIKYVHEQTKGIVAARNRGVSEARGAWLAFFDDDQVAEANWLKELLSAASLAESSLVGGSILLRLPASCALALGPIARNVLGEHLYVGAARMCQGKSIPSTGNMLVARETLDVVGLFDSSMHAGGSDTDFVMRALSSGITVSVAPAATVHHIIAPSRATLDYLRWTSTRTGYHYAVVDLKYDGRMSMIARAIARIGQAVFANVPLLIVAAVKRDPTSCLDRRCLLWRAVGYVRGAVSLACPQKFKHSRFLSELNIRRGRTTFSN